MKKSAIDLKLIFMLMLTFSSTVHGEIYSYLFKDVIDSKGQGQIDLLKARNNSVVVNGAVLEEFRLDNNGQLIFAVDVNEAADGSENADSQGLAIKSATLVLMIDNVEYRYEVFSTNTKTLLIENGTSVRSEYYSLIGVGGSSLISPNIKSELTGTSIDSTIRFEINEELTNVTAANLSIVLLDTATSLGDPEAFYDYSNGYEEIALLTAEDVAYLESLARGVAYAPMVILGDNPDSMQWTYYPASDAFYVAAYEDLYPNRGDYDFNDLVVAYQLKIGRNSGGKVSIVRGNGYLISRGAEYNHDWYLGIDLPSEASGNVAISFFDLNTHAIAEGFPKQQGFSGKVNLLLAENIANSFYDGELTYVNTLAEQSIVQGPKFEFEIVLDAPIAIDFTTQLPFDPFIYVHDTGYEIHLVEQLPALSFSNNAAEGLTDFKDSDGFPFAILVTEDWMPPLAGIDMGLAYPEFMTHVSSNGAQKKDWSMLPDSSKIKSIPFISWQW